MRTSTFFLLLPNWGSAVANRTQRKTKLKITIIECAARAAGRSRRYYPPLRSTPATSDPHGGLLYHMRYTNPGPSQHIEWVLCCRLGRSARTHGLALRLGCPLHSHVPRRLPRCLMLQVLMLHVSLRVSLRVSWSRSRPPVPLLCGSDASI